MPVLYYGVPGGGTYFAPTALTDSGDHTKYNFTSGYFISNFVDDEGNDYSPDVLVDGVISGGVGTPAASETNDYIDVSALSANIAGTQYSGSTQITDTDIECTRGAGSSTAYIINSLSCDSAGSWTMTAGTGSTAFDLTGRGGAGQPPYVPVGEIEVLQVRFTSETAAAVTSDEIKMIPNVTREMANSPGGDIHFARVSGGALEYPGFTTRVALGAIHTGDVTRKVYMSGYYESFAEWNNAYDVAFQGESISSETLETYTGVTSYTSADMTDGSFEWAYTSLTSDPEWAVLSKGKDAKTWFKLYESRTADSYTACQAVAAGSPTVNASGPTTMTISLSGGSKYLRILG